MTDPLFEDALRTAMTAYERTIRAIFLDEDRHVGPTDFVEWEPTTEEKVSVEINGPVPVGCIIHTPRPARWSDLDADPVADIRAVIDRWSTP